MTHISAIPLELIVYIFKWVVSSELDMKSLEQLARVNYSQTRLQNCMKPLLVKHEIVLSTGY